MGGGDLGGGGGDTSWPGRSVGLADRVVGPKSPNAWPERRVRPWTSQPHLED